MAVAFKEVDDGVFRLTTSEPGDEVVSKVHCYLIETGARKFTLVDSGWASSGAELAAAIRKELGDGVAVERLLLTHLHPDHFGGSKAIVKTYSSRMSYHRKENLHWTYYNILREDITRASILLGAPMDVLEAAKARITASRALLPEPDSYLADGTTIRGRSGAWRIVHTPGHSPGHVCLYRQRDRTLISGDHILERETPNVAFYPVPGYSALRSYLTSLAKVKRLAPTRALPAHGEVIGAVNDKIDTLSAHHQERLLEVFQGLRGGVRTVEEVAAYVKWSRGPLESLGRFNRWLATLETISHLEFLAECGVVQRESGPLHAYRATGRGWQAVQKTMDRLLAA